MMKGFLLALQFFTIIPIHKELPMTKKYITQMFIALPIVGALIGGVAAMVFWVLHDYTSFSSLLITLAVLLTLVKLTGGLHLDGLIDMGDAYFSYRSIEKRHEILDDPRVGAFGVMTIVFFILTKFIILNELILSNEMTFYWLIFIPFLARISMAHYLIITPASKEKGIGAFFRAHISLRKFSVIMLVFLLLSATLVGWYSEQWLIALSMVIASLIAPLFYKYWTAKNFNGSSGDLFGAFIEGMELLLWIILLIFIS
ncbi:MAG TPA: adenosylcobinamide-GDP ribazoletransferase [Kurthia sp.]